MFESSDFEHAQGFLQQQMAHTQAKIARIEHALELCHTCDEAEGLAVMQNAVQMEADLIEELAHHLHDTTVSLDTLLMQEIETYEREVDHYSHHWQRGQPTPDGYWAAEGKVVFLKGLQRNFHAWRAGRPLSGEDISAYVHHTTPQPNRAVQPLNRNVPSDVQPYLHPWYADSHLDSREESTVGQLVRLRQDILSALLEEGVPEDHLEVIVQPNGEVIITGYVHTAEEKENVITAVEHVPDVMELLTDIKVVSQAHCPACHALNES